MAENKKENPLKKRGPGRPSKAALAKAKKPGRVGRPKGTAAIMQDYKARMLASPKSQEIIQKVMQTALEDGHPHQAACMKMVWDRVLPASWFEKEGGGSGHKLEISINVGDPDGNSSVAVSRDDDAIDGEFETVDEVDADANKPS
jgi:hypothetical protein